MNDSNFKTDTPYEPPILQSLIEISQSMISISSPDEMLRLIQERVISMFDVAGCSIGLLDETSGELAFVAMEGSLKVDEFRVPPGKGISGWVVRTGLGVMCNDPYRDPRFFGAVDEDTGHKTQSILCAPLKRGDTLIGVIQAINTRRPGKFNETDLEVLTTLGKLAGSAISHTRKFGIIRNVGAAYKEEVEHRYKLVGGRSEAMRDALEMAKRVAASNSTVLLMSESGTGKEVISRSIHQWSARKSHPFVAVNCVALTSDLLASELFGHEKGAFTGATSQKKGKFELANGGTIFLDEIGDLEMDLQVKLLRVLQDREFQRVGGNRDIRTDVRIIAATNRDLPGAIKEGKFREDLYYRLNVITITMPPLRDRGDDIPELIHHFIRRSCSEVGRAPIGIDPEAIHLLINYEWPGNVRELQNVIERAVVLTASDSIGVSVLPNEIHKGKTVSGPETLSYGHLRNEIDENLPLNEAVEVFKRHRLRRALERTGGNQSKAAALLGMQASNLSRMLKKFGFQR